MGFLIAQREHTCLQKKLRGGGERDEKNCTKTDYRIICRDKNK